MWKWLLALIPGVGPGLAAGAEATSLLKNWKLILGALAALVIIGACAFFVISYQHRGETIAKLSTQVADLQTQVETEKEKAVLVAAAQKVLVERLNQSTNRKIETSRITETARHAPPESNGAIAPVMRDTLASLRRLRAPEGSGEADRRAGP